MPTFAFSRANFLYTYLRNDLLNAIYNLLFLHFSKTSDCTPSCCCRRRATIQNTTHKLRRRVVGRLENCKILFFFTCKPTRHQQQSSCIPYSAKCRQLSFSSFPTTNGIFTILHMHTIYFVEAIHAFIIYLSTERTRILSMLCDFHFFHHFTQRSTITCAIFTNNTNFLSSFRLSNK